MPSVSRRELLQMAATGALGAAASMLAARPGLSLAQGRGGQPAPTDGRALGSAPDGGPWNVLVMVSDEHSPKLLDAVSPWVGTPHLSRLAAEGVSMPRCYATSPLCAPARMGLLTGLFPTENGVMGNGQALDPRFKTIAHTFSAAGYDTACIGKTHTNHPTATYGFDYWMNEDSAAFQEAWRAGRKEAAPLPVPADEAALWEGIADRRLRGAPIATERTPISGIVLDHAGHWLRNRSPDRPFFLYTSWTEPHWYWNLPRSFYGRHSPADVPLPRLVPGELDDAPMARSIQLKNGWDKMSEAQHRLCLARYADAVSYSDWVVGQLLGLLDELGLARRTLVLYTSDHGDMAAEKRLWLKGLMFDAAAGVPMLMRMPGVIAPATTHQALFSGADVLPTLAGLAAVKPASPVSGFDHSAALRGQADATAPSMVFSCLSGRPSVRLPGQFMARSDLYKLVRYGDRKATSISGETRELYDMHEDPDEVHNLAGDPGNRARVADLVEAGDDWLRSRNLSPYPVLRAADLAAEAGSPALEEPADQD